MWFAQSRDTHKTLDVVAQNFATNHHQRLSKDHNRQIKYLWPEAFITEWKMDNQELKLLIRPHIQDLPRQYKDLNQTLNAGNANKNRRITTFQEKLIEFARSHPLADDFPLHPLPEKPLSQPLIKKCTAMETPCNYTGDIEPLLTTPTNRLDIKCLQ